MSNALETITREAVRLPRQQRLSLARLLIDLDSVGEEVADVEGAWDAEIRERVRAVEEGRVEGIPWDEVLDRVDRRLAS